MTTLLLAEHDNKTLKDATHKALTAAKALGADVHVLVAGKGCRAVAEAAAKLDGVNKVLLADGAAYEHMLAEPVGALVHSLAPGYDAMVAPATTTGKNVMPRIAALLDVMQISDITKVIAADTFERLIYAGNAIQTVRSKDKTKVITVRTSTFQATGEGGSAPIEEVAAAADSGISTFVGEGTSPSTSSRSPTSWAPPSALRARRWMPAMRRTIGRSGKPARWWRPNSTSRWGFRARSSIWQG